MTVLDMLRAPWAIEPEILTEMCAVYMRHRSGENIDLNAIAAAAGRTMNNAPKPYEVQDGVAMVPIEGVLSKRMSLFTQICGGMSYSSLQQDLAQALADPDVTSIILTIDSPGGTVDGLEAAGEAIYGARSKKPVVAYVDGKATSAAYWLGSAASQIYIGSDADAVGSIGVISTHIDTSNAEYMRGVKYTDLAAGRYKATGTSHAPLSAQDRGIIQDQLDQLYGNFVNTVARNRGVPSQTVAKDMADGRIFLGKRAIDAGLVDGKTTLPALMEKMRSKSKTPVSSVRSNATGAPSSRVRSEDSTTPLSAISVAPDIQTAAVPDPQKAAAAAPTHAELQIAKLRVLIEEEISTRRLLKDAQGSLKTAELALHQASRTRAKAEELLPYTTAVSRAHTTIRDLSSRLITNEQEQKETLRTNPSREKENPVKRHVQTLDPVELASKASAMVKEARAQGRQLSSAQAVANLMAQEEDTNSMPLSYAPAFAGPTAKEKEITNELAARIREKVENARAQGKRLSFADAVASLTAN